MVITWPRNCQASNHLMDGWVDAGQSGCWNHGPSFHGQPGQPHEKWWRNWMIKDDYRRFPVVIRVPVVRLNLAKLERIRQIRKTKICEKLSHHVTHVPVSGQKGGIWDHQSTASWAISQDWSSATNGHRDLRGSEGCQKWSEEKTPQLWVRWRTFQHGYHWDHM